MSPAGVYACEIPYNSSTTRELNVYLYTGQVAGKKDLIVHIQFYFAYNNKLLGIKYL